MHKWIFFFSALLLLLSLTGPASAETDAQAEARKSMVTNQIKARGVRDEKVLAAMTAIPRHRFVPGRQRHSAYADRPLPIGEGQTISQPYIVALMTASLKLTGEERVLEVGTGSGYQAAVLARVAQDVYTMEIRAKLHQQAARRFQEMGMDNIRSKQGDGYFGWPQAGPFEAIMITAAVDHIPPPLLEQLREGGRLILPLGDPFGYQNLVLVTKSGGDYTVRQIIGVLFVPMTGHALSSRKAD
jgi:protein-L-isoaspartate(D-aspartate) O-methyltransferase